MCETKFDAVQYYWHGDGMARSIYVDPVTGVLLKPVDLSPTPSCVEHVEGRNEVMFEGLLFELLAYKTSDLIQ